MIRMRVGLLVAIFMGTTLAGCTPQASKHPENETNGRSTTKVIGGSGPQGLPRGDRSELVVAIKSIREERAQIEAASENDMEEGESGLHKDEILDLLNEAEQLDFKELHLLEAFDRLTGEDDHATLQALNAWRDASVGPIASRAQPYGCGGWDNGSCHDDLVVPMRTQVLKLHPILEHGLVRMEAYLAESEPKK